MTRHKAEVCCGNCGAKMNVNLTLTGAERDAPTQEKTEPIGPPVPDDLKGWLQETSYLRCLAHDRYGAWWNATVKAFDVYPFIFFDEEIRKAEAWLHANPRKRPRKDFQRFFTHWLNVAVEAGRRQEMRADAAARRPR